MSKPGSMAGEKCFMRVMKFEAWARGSLAVFSSSILSEKYWQLLGFFLFLIILGLRTFSSLYIYIK